MVEKVLRVVAFGSLCLALMVGVYLLSDKQAPIIEVANDSALNVSCELSDAQIYDKVTAYDKVDGDLTEAIFIEENSVDAIKTSKKITYVVIDSSNNVAKLTRKLISSDLENEWTIYSYLPSKIDLNEEIDLAEYIVIKDGCGDLVEGGLSLPELDTTVEGEVVLLITDTRGISEALEVTVMIVDLKSPKFELINDQIEVDLGEEITYTSLINSIEDDIDSKDQLLESLTVSGYIDTNISGTYTLTFTIKDSEGNMSVQNLTVVVLKEAGE